MKDYWLAFSSGNPANYTGLSPTFTYFVNAAGQTLAPPAITEPLAGSGLYHFSYFATLSIAFVVDGFTTSLTASDRYIRGVLDPLNNVDSVLGTTNSSFGSTSTDPGQAMGYLKRIMELLEGNQTFTKASGAYLMYSRGSSTLLRSKTVDNAAAEVTKT